MITSACRRFGGGEAQPCSSVPRQYLCQEGGSPDSWVDPGTRPRARTDGRRVGHGLAAVQVVGTECARGSDATLTHHAFMPLSRRSTRPVEQRPPPPAYGHLRRRWQTPWGASCSRRWRAAQVGGEAERYGARNRGGGLPAASREHRSMWLTSSSRSGTSGCLSGDGARRPVCSAGCYRAAVGEKGGGPRMVIPRGFAVADAWRRARSTRSAVSSVAGSLAPR